MKAGIFMIFEHGKQSIKQKGFSLLDVIVAIFIVTVGLVAVSTLVNSSLRAVSAAENKIIASGLAQEGIETVRFLRGASGDWNAWFGSASTGDYRIQYNSSNLEPYADSFLLVDPAVSLYQYTSGNPSIFKRKISITSVSSQEVVVKSIITWADRGTSYSLEVEDRLWNWK